MLRIALFLLTNLAIIVIAGIVLSVWVLVPLTAPATP
jgi:hypothetical protein